MFVVFFGWLSDSLSSGGQKVFGLSGDWVSVDDLVFLALEFNQVLVVVDVFLEDWLGVDFSSRGLDFFNHSLVASLSSLDDWFEALSNGGLFNEINFFFFSVNGWLDGFLEDGDLRRYNNFFSLWEVLLLYFCFLLDSVGDHWS